ncbi:MAG: tRNA adenosine(34) deaminase TadA [Oscillospiraceae bacterium]|nr:tRNA adenosine(34) deaminase TadA [Oscillospiraceae bacterium]
MVINTDFMREALKLAETAKNTGEVPVGCVIVCDKKIIASGYNRRENDQDALAHAELAAIKTACEFTGYWRLCGCELYVTLEPCVMCAGAVINARIDRVVFGARDKKAGAFGGVINLNDYGFNHKPEIIGGVLEAESSALLSGFFSELRLNKKPRPDFFS